MLDKYSQKILSSAIQKYKTENVNFHTFYSSDAASFNMSKERLLSTCEQLANEGYLYDFVKYYDDGCRFRLTNKGLVYFETKRKEQFHFWIPIIVSNLIAIIALLHSIFTS